MDLPQTRRRRGQQLEDALLDAAWAELLDSGHAGLTMEAVAERAGTSRPVLYRRWPDRDALIGAALAHGLRRTRMQKPDTGTLRGDMIAVLQHSNAQRARIIPLVSVLVADHFSATGTSFADIREQMLLGAPGTVVDEILEAAVARGEVDPARLTPRVRTVAFDLFRHDLLMTLKPLDDAQIESIVDEVFLPLVGAASG